MSLRAMVWALEEAPVEDPASLLVLWALCERAHEDGTCAWPTQEHMAYRARCSGRSVRRKLVELEAAGIIARGDQRLVEHIPGRNRPVVWDVDLTQKRADTLAARPTPPPAPPASAGPDVAERDERAAGGGEEPVAGMGLVLAIARPPDPDVGTEFEAWWVAYPRKVGKTAAEAAYRRARRRASAEQLTGALEQDVAVTWARTEARFIPHPTTWLNQGRWDDERDQAAALHPTDAAMARNLATLHRLEAAGGAQFRDLWEIES